MKELVHRLVDLLMPDFEFLLREFRGTMQGGRQKLYDDMLRLELQRLSAKRKSTSLLMDGEGQSSKDSAGTVVPSKRCCCICKESLSTPFEALCGHVGCYECWNQVLRQADSHCPDCGSLILKKQLKKLYLFS